MSSVTAQMKILEEIKKNGTDEAFYKDMISFEKYLDTVNIDRYNEMDKKYMFNLD